MTKKQVDTINHKIENINKKFLLKIKKLNEELKDLKSKQVIKKEVAKSYINDKKYINK
jgi:hypothetical protein